MIGGTGGSSDRAWCIPGPHIISKIVKYKDIGEQQKPKINNRGYPIRCDDSQRGPARGYLHLPGGRCRTFRSSDAPQHGFPRARGLKLVDRADIEPLPRLDYDNHTQSPVRSCSTSRARWSLISLSSPHHLPLLPPFKSGSSVHNFTQIVRVKTRFPCQQSWTKRTRMSWQSWAPFTRISTGSRIVLGAVAVQYLTFLGLMSLTYIFRTLCVKKQKKQLNRVARFWANLIEQPQQSRSQAESGQTDDNSKCLRQPRW